MMDAARPTRRRPEDVAALVNALVVLVLPPVLIGIGMTFFPSNPSGTTVHADESFAANGARFAEGLAILEIPLLPIAVLAGWRTWVHARRYCEGSGTGLQGLLEGGAAGFGLIFVPLVLATLSRPRALALAYSAFYGVFGLIGGLVFSSVLCVSSHIVLRLIASRLSVPPS